MKGKNFDNAVVPLFLAGINDVFKSNNCPPAVDASDVAYKFAEKYGYFVVEHVEPVDPFYIVPMLCNQNISHLITALGADKYADTATKAHDLFEKCLVNAKAVAGGEGIEFPGVEKELFAITVDLENTAQDLIKKDFSLRADATQMAVGRTTPVVNGMVELTCDLIQKFDDGGLKVSGVHINQGYGEPMNPEGILLRNNKEKNEEVFHRIFKKTQIYDEITAEEISNCARLSCPTIYLFVNDPASNPITVRIADHPEHPDGKKFIHPDYEHSDGQFLGQAEHEIVVDAAGGYSKDKEDEIVSSLILPVSKESAAVPEMAIG